MLIEPTVEQRVAAGGGHGEAVAACEAEGVPSPAVDLEVEVLGQVDDVKRQPADDEHEQYGHKDAAASSVPLPLLSPPDGAPASSRPHSSSPE